MDKTLTVFTPTYNRAYTLSNLIGSLMAQTDHRFEWFVIDDGSSDQMSELLSHLSKEKLSGAFRYLGTKDGGKQRAINLAVKEIISDYKLILD